MKDNSITFVIPFFNEKDYIEQTLNSIDRQNLKNIHLEVLLYNGKSNDHSEEVVKNFIQSSKDRKIKYRLLENPFKKTPFAFNLGIKLGTGEYIGFGGAHTEYPPDYFQNAMNLFSQIQADVVGGGFTDYVPDNDTPLGHAIACLYKTPIGSGVAKYHRLRKPAYVDTVYGGFYRREIFSSIGGFNTALKKNQDNEFNARVTAGGFKIYFDPILSTEYIIKTKFTTFCSRAYSFGNYHLETWRTNIRSFRFRHAIPGIFVIYIIVNAIMYYSNLHKAIMLIPAFIYLSLLLINSFYFSNKKGLAVGILTIPVNFIFHLCYGMGTLLGAFKKRSSQ
jgi:succinoglycan biosynthesis protein ExoA